MISIRRNTFETNSSSTHSISVCTKDEWSKFLNGQIWFSKESGALITKEEIKYTYAYKDWCHTNDIPKEEIESVATIDAYIDDCVGDWYGDLQTDDTMEFPVEHVYDASGNPIVVYSYYYSD